jgi:GNAT superfamily N-acetyltransferase
MTFRRADEADLEAILAMRVAAATWLQSRGIAQWNPDGFTLDETREDFACNRIFVLEDDMGKLAGSLVLHDDDPRIWPEATAGEAYYLHRLVTARERAGAGLGAVLLSEALRVASDRPLLRLDCWAGNVTLRTYYAGLGFRPVDETDVEEWRVARFERET